MGSGRDAGAYTLLAVGVGVTGVLSVFGADHLADGDTVRALVYLILGWGPFAIAWYAVGRLFSSPQDLPSMRPVDAGVALFLGSVLVSVGFDSLGATPERVPELYVLPAVGVYVGLALVGWGLGRRARAIGEFEREG